MLQFIAGDVVCCTSSHQGLTRGSLYVIESVDRVGIGIAEYMTYTLSDARTHELFSVVNLRFIARRLTDQELAEWSANLAATVPGINL